MCFWLTPRKQEWIDRIKKVDPNISEALLGAIRREIDIARSENKNLSVIETEEVVQPEHTQDKPEGLSREG